MDDDFLIEPKQLTEEEIRAEQEKQEILNRIIYHCKTDFPLFAKSFLKIVNKDGSEIPFELNSQQLELHEIIEKQKRDTGKVRIICLKSRQLGISTYCAARITHQTIFNKHKRAFVVTHQGSTTKAIFRVYKRFVNRLPDLLKPILKVSNSNELEFEGQDSSIVVSTANSSETGRGDTAQYAHLSEVAFWENGEELASGLMTAISNSDGTEIIIESTARGVGELFHRMWTNAVLGKNDYIPVFLNWTKDTSCRAKPPLDFEATLEEKELAAQWKLDDHQLWWRRSTIADKGEEKFFQEYPLTAAEAFRYAIVNSFIEPDDVKRARGKVLPIKNDAPLILGVDVAREGDDSTCIVKRRGRVLEGYNLYQKMKGDQIAYIIAEIIKKEQPAAINIDGTGGYGSAVHDALRMLGYESKEINFSSAPYNDDYFNRRAEMYGSLKDWLQNEVSIPDDDLLEEEIVSIGYSHKGEKLKIEDKREIKKRLKRSPDIADALVLTFATPVNEYSTVSNKAWEKLKKRTPDYAW